ncbi:MAG: ion channel [Rothia sp. (in: high G+C Gram-positive bacteria)]|uniref:potassium channel family protein n=1 Tax=Rothia sp. (in: high G+C Gram-positive bacteria) TaxID=1885016 RepID=UPI0026DEDCF6|nr:potassium channel family protein [Rothia sp. (in: high G+C Gram-positive bacteria)]MDO5750695.1 ion channel [Rothia sp. (in: high G+C Gram-positive bacteria)]
MPDTSSARRGFRLPGGFRLRRGDENLRLWEEKLNTPLFVASLMYLVVYAVPILSSSLLPQVELLFLFTQVLLWLVFAVDYAVRLYLSPQRFYFVTHNLPNLAVVLLPAWRIVGLLAMINITATRQYKRLSEFVMRMLGYTIIFIIVAALGVYAVEDGAPGALITDVWVAYWWVMCTLATVGYGDVYPVTIAGRILAALVMVYGVGMFGMVIGTISTWIIEKISGITEEDHAATKSDVAEIEREVTELKQIIMRQDFLIQQLAAAHLESVSQGDDIAQGDDMEQYSRADGAAGE